MALLVAPALEVVFVPAFELPLVPPVELGGSSSLEPPPLSNVMAVLRETM